MTSLIIIPTPRTFSFPRTVVSHGWCELLPFSIDREAWELTRVLALDPRPPVTVQISARKRELHVKTSRKLTRTVADFHTYITANENFIPNYRDRYRYGEVISTAFVESTVNQMISKRLVKKQQMRWTKKGAHLLLQVRAQVLNEDLRSTFERWYPTMTSTDVSVALAA